MLWECRSPSTFVTAHGYFMNLGHWLTPCSTNIAKIQAIFDVSNVTIVMNYEKFVAEHFNLFATHLNKKK